MRRLLILVTIAAAFAAIVGAPSAAIAGSCSGDKSVMTSTSNSAAVVNGYVCAQEDHWSSQSIGAGQSHSLTSKATSDYATWYHCSDATSDAVSISYGVAFGSATYSAFNSLTPSNTRKWGAGMLWTYMNTTPSGFSKGCDYDGAMWDHPPAILDITSISGTPPTTATAGTAVNIAVSVSPSSATGTVAVQDHGVSVASATLSGGKATIKWTPAVDGTSSLKLVYAGSSSKTPATTGSKSVAVSGGTGVAITAASGAGATVNLTSTTSTSGTVTLIDVNTKKPIGTANVASIPGTAFSGTASANVLFAYAAGKSYTVIATLTNALGQTTGQSYPFTWSSSGATPASRSISIALSGVPTTTTAGKAYPIVVSVTPASATGVVAVQDAGRSVGSATLANGTATINWTPAVTGTSRLTFVYTGDAANPFVMSAPNTTSCPAIPASGTTPAVSAASYCVPVTGGTSVTITSVASTNTLNASATVKVAPTTSVGSVTLMDVGTSSKLGSGTLANGVATIAFNYVASTTYTLVAKFCTSSTTCPGQSYSVTWDSAQVAKSLVRLNSIPTGLTNLPTGAQPRQNATEVVEAAMLAVSGADPQVSYVTRRTSSSSAITINCPAGTRMISADAMTNGPEDNVELGSFTDTGVKVVPDPTDVGSTIISQVMCRPRSAKATTSGQIVYGSIFPNRIALTGSLTMGFGGPGKDLMTSTVANSTLWGGLGQDVMIADGAGGVAAGGPGADVIIAGGSGTHLLVGGLGRDSMTSSFNADLINARDGKGGDVVTCRNAQVRVMADVGDIVTGPCLQVDTTNGKGTVVSGS